jgi:peptidyl-prolyl cis-trans isomerase C
MTGLTMIRTSIKLSVITVAVALLAPAALAENSAAPTKVNGKPISSTQVEFLVASQKAQGRPDSPELRNAAREEVIRREVLFQEAVKQGIDKRSDVKSKLELAHQGVVISAYVEGFVKAHPVSDDAVKKEYEALKAQVGDKEYKVRHILVDGEDEAKDIIARLKKGEKFETLASQSKDPGSKEKGGDLGWSVPTSYVKVFADAMVKLNKGQYTDVPVKSEFGWHIIQLDDTRALKVPPLEEAKPQILQRLQQQLVEKQVMELRSKAKVD